MKVLRTENRVLQMEIVSLGLEMKTSPNETSPWDKSRMKDRVLVDQLKKLGVAVLGSANSVIQADFRNGE